MSNGMKIQEARKLLDDNDNGTLSEWLWENREAIISAAEQLAAMKCEKCGGLKLEMDTQLCPGHDPLEVASVPPTRITERGE